MPSKNIPLSKDEIEKLKIDIEINKFNIHLTRQKYNLSQATISKYIKKYNIKIKKGFYNKIGQRKKRVVKESTKEILREKLKGKGNPFYGKKHSEKTKEKMKKNHADFTGDKNPFRIACKKNPDLKIELGKKISQSWKNKTEEEKNIIKQKLSKSITESSKFNNGVFHKNHKSKSIETKKAGKIFCRSSWEVIVAQLLDEMEEVLFFSLEQIVIKYKLDNIIKNTRIDFYVETNKEKIIIEVKPKNIQKIKNNPNKIKAYEEYCKKNNYKFMIIDEECIFDKEKIKNKILGINIK